jgi:hypothetical protein
MNRLPRSMYLQALKDVRVRGGHISTNNYGLNMDIVDERVKLFAAILYERQIGLTYLDSFFRYRWLSEKKLIILFSFLCVCTRNTICSQLH